jgi:hypothetical protein
MNTYTAIAPNGQAVTRKTKNVYTHAVLVELVNGSYKASHFSSSLAGAEKMAADDLRWYGWESVIVEAKVAA